MSAARPDGYYRRHRPRLICTIFAAEMMREIARVYRARSATDHATCEIVLHPSDEERLNSAPDGYLHPRLFQIRGRQCRPA